MADKLNTPVFKRVRPAYVAAEANTDPRLVQYPELLIVDDKLIDRGNILSKDEEYIPSGDPVDSQDTVIEGLTDGGEVYLDKDITISSEGLTQTSSKDVYTISLDGTLDLNKKTLDIESYLVLEDNTNLTIKGGTIKSDMAESNQKTQHSLLSAPANGSLVIEDCTIDITTPYGNAVFAGKENSEVTLRNCIFNVYCFSIGTNASNPPSGVKINVENCRFVSKSNVPVLINIPVNASFKDCYFSGEYQGAILRGGTYEFENCEFVERGEDDWNEENVQSIYNKYFRPENTSASLQKWGSGNSCPLAALTIGNNSNSAYRYPTVVDLKNCKLSVPAEFSGKGMMPALYAHANPEEGNGVTLTYDKACTFVGEVVLDGDNIVCNGEKANEA